MTIAAHLIHATDLQSANCNRDRSIGAEERTRDNTEKHTASLRSPIRPLPFRRHGFHDCRRAVNVVGRSAERRRSDRWSASAAIPSASDDATRSLFARFRRAEPSAANLRRHVRAWQRRSKWTQQQR